MACTQANSAKLVRLIFSCSCITRARSSAMNSKAVTPGHLDERIATANGILLAPDGCWLISTGKPGEVGNVLRFDPRAGGSLKRFIEIPEGYGGRVLRPTGMTWWGNKLLVASQIDGKVKCYEYPSGEWLGDSVTAAPGGMTQITLVDENVVCNRLRGPCDSAGELERDAWQSRSGPAVAPYRK